MLFLALLPSLEEKGGKKFGKRKRKESNRKK